MLIPSDMRLRPTGPALDGDMLTSHASEQGVSLCADYKFAIHVPDRLLDS